MEDNFARCLEASPSADGVGRISSSADDDQRYAALDPRHLFEKRWTKTFHKKVF